MVFATVYLHFYLLIFTFILRILKFIQCPYAFNKNQQSFDKVQCSFYKVFILKMLLSHVLFSMKKTYETAKITPGLNTCTCRARAAQRSAC